MLHRAKRMLLIFAAICLAVWWIIGRVPTAFLPDEDQGYILANVNLPAGATDARLQDVLEQMSQYCKNVPEVISFNQVSGLNGDQSSARAFIRLKPWDQRPQASQSAAAIAHRATQELAKIRDARIPYQVPEPADLPERLDAVLHVVYLVFNEGYAASSGEALTRADLSGEAIRLARLLFGLLPEPEVAGLLALPAAPPGRTPTATSSCWKTRTARCGTASRSPMGRRSSSGRSRAAASARTQSRRPSRPSTPTRRTPPRPTGPRSSRSTTCCWGWRRRRWSSSTAPSPSPCATARRPAWR
mgnify:CR=1 FL=1